MTFDRLTDLGAESPALIVGFLASGGSPRSQPAGSFATALREGNVGDVITEAVLTYLSYLS